MITRIDSRHIKILTFSGWERPEVVLSMILSVNLLSKSWILSNPFKGIRASIFHIVTSKFWVENSLNWFQICYSANCDRNSHNQWISHMHTQHLKASESFLGAYEFISHKYFLIFWSVNVLSPSPLKLFELKNLPRTLCYTKSESFDKLSRVVWKSIFHNITNVISE